jgi:hypothetical protein
MHAPDFGNLTIFPGFNDLPEVGSPDQPQAAPYLIGQIKDNMTITKPTLILFDREDVPFALVFDDLTWDGIDFRGLGMKKGNTIVLPNAKRTPSKEEGKKGFVIVEKGREKDVHVISAPLAKVMELGTWMMRRETESKDDGCDSCQNPAPGGGSSSLMKCNGCSSVRYCSKVRCCHTPATVFSTDTCSSCQRLARSSIGVTEATRATARSSRRLRKPGNEFQLGSGILHSTYSHPKRLNQTPMRSSHT